MNKKRDTARPGIIKPDATPDPGGSGARSAVPGGRAKGESCSQSTTPVQDADSPEAFSLGSSSAPLGMFCSRLDGLVTFLNPWMASHLGYPDPNAALDAINRDIAAFYPDMDRVAHLTELLAEQDRVNDFELPVRRRGGDVIWLSLHCVLVEDDEGYHVEGYATDIGPRKRSQAALQQNEQRYRAIVEDQTEFICRYAPDGTLTFINESYARYFGKTQEELLHSRFTPPLPKEDRAPMRERIASLSPRSPVVSLEHRVLMPYGGTRWNLWTLRAIYDDDGRVTEYQAVGRDVTGQKLTEQALRKSEERFRLLAENMGEMVCLMDADGRLKYVSPSCYRLLGFAPQEMAEQPFSEFLHPDDKQAMRQAFTGFNDRMTPPQDTIVRMRRQTGRHVWLEVCTTPVWSTADSGEQSVAGIVASARDITARREAETACRNAEERYRSLFENSTLGIYRSSPEGRFTMVNESLARTFGFDSPREMIDHYHNVGLQMYVGDGRRADVLAELAMTGHLQHCESQVYRKDGSIIWISETGRQVLDEKGDVVCYDGTMTDITERKRFERELATLNQHLEQLVEERTWGLRQKTEELEQANRRLQELDEMKSALLSSVSHELRTPLTSIRGFAKLVDRDFARRFVPLAGDDGELAKKADDIRSNLHIIGEQSGRLTDLINSFLELSAIESGTLNWDEGPVDLPGAVGQAMEAARILFHRRQQVRLAADVPATLPRIRGDERRIVQLLIHLLDNAAKFTLQGEVLLRAVAAPQADGTPAVRLEVRDTGRGIDSSELATIFESFQQGTQNVLSDKPAGAGLGLAICRRIVEHHNGRIWAESEPGCGSTFFVELPATAAA